MFLNVLATIRPTETWTLFHGTAALAAVFGLVLLVRSLRVRGRR